MQVMSKAEIGFIKAIVQPLWLRVNQLLDEELQQECDNIQDNIEKWEA